MGNSETQFSIPCMLAHTREHCVILEVCSAVNMVWLRFRLGSGSVIENHISCEDLLIPEVRNERERRAISGLRFHRFGVVPSATAPRDAITVDSSRVSALRQRMQSIASVPVVQHVPVPPKFAPCPESRPVVPSSERMNRLKALMGK